MRAKKNNIILLNFYLLFHLKNIFSFFLFLSPASLLSSFFLLIFFSLPHQLSASPKTVESRNFEVDQIGKRTPRASLWFAKEILIIRSKFKKQSAIMMIMMKVQFDQLYWRGGNRSHRWRQGRWKR